MADKSTSTSDPVTEDDHVQVRVRSDTNTGTGTLLCDPKKSTQMFLSLVPFWLKFGQMVLQCVFIKDVLRWFCLYRFCL